MHDLNWISFLDRLPEKSDGVILVTNNLFARDSYGAMSHVWATSHDRLHPQDGLRFYSCTVPGSADQMYYLTHWAIPGQVKRTGPVTPDNSMVICPCCTSQFKAIPVEVQWGLSSLGQLRNSQQRVIDQLRKKIDCLRMFGERAMDLLLKSPEVQPKAEAQNGASPLPSALQDQLNHVCAELAEFKELAARRAQRLQKEKHMANQWADMATSGLQRMRNVRDWVSTPYTAIVEMESDMKRIQQLQQDAKK